MKCFRRWQRISILFLISLSAFLPILLLLNRLQNFTSQGREVFVEDLPTIKYRTDVLPLSAVGQEAREGVKEPHPEVYEDQKYSVHSGGSGAGGIRTLERRANELRVRGETKPIQLREEPSPRIIKNHSDQRSSQQDDGAQAHGVTTIRHRQVSHAERQRVRAGKVKQMKDQVIRAKAYLGFATSTGNTHLARELKIRIGEAERALSRFRRDSDLSRRTLRKIKNMEHTLSKAGRTYSDCSDMINRLLSVSNNAENEVQLLSN